MKNFSRAFTIFGALMFLRGNASGKRVDRHIIASKYWLPARVFGRGRTQSMTAWLNGSSTAGIGFNGGLRLGFPTF